MTGSGFDLMTSCLLEPRFEELFGLIRDELRRSGFEELIAAGGAGSIDDFAKAVTEGGVSAVAAGSRFVFVGPHRAVLINYPERKELLARLRLDLCVPMIHVNRLTGILLLGGDRKEWNASRIDVEMLDLLASQASLAFENAALYRAQSERLDRLHRAERLAAVGQLAAGLAHEIRNPLTAIRSTMQYLLQEFDPGEPRHELVEELLSEVDRINGTVGGLLSLSRTGELRLAEIDLLDPLSASVHLVQARADEQGVVLEPSFGREPLPVLADAGQLKQVFLNLLLNALQAMPEGGRITLAAEQWGPPPNGGRWGQVRIADTGPGIPAEELRKVFDPFFTTKRDGTGLGLAICHGIVEQHQGEIRLESEIGRGTTALVRLPLVG